jgi:iron complex outermembrane recepter protein
MLAVSKRERRVGMRFVTVSAGALISSLTCASQGWSQVASAPAAQQASAQTASPQVTSQATPLQAGAATSAGQAPPKAALSEVVVTATRTGATALQSTPIAIAAYTGQQLSDHGIQNARDLVSLSPNIQISDLAGQSSIFIRGIGTNNDGYVGSDPSSTLQIDGVYISRALAYNQDFLDVDRIEVLRGPQGTLYGRNAVGGTINIISRAPSDSFTGQVQLQGGSFGEFGASAYVSGPVADGVLGSLAYQHVQHDPYLRNVSTGGGVQSDDTDALRGQLLFPLGDRASLTLRADYSTKDWAVASFPKLLQPDGSPLDDSVLGNFTKVSINQPSHAYEEDGGVAAELNYRINDMLSFKSLTAARADKAKLSFDADSSSLNILHTLTNPSVEDQFSEEANLTARTDRLTVVGGVYYYLENFSDPLLVSIYPADVSSVRRASLTDEAVAVYGQGEYRLTDQISLIAGVRYTDERKHLRASLYYDLGTSLDQSAQLVAPVVGLPYFPDPFRVDAARTDNAWTPKFGINYKPLKTLLIYGSATRGFKSGGYAIGSPDAADLAAGYAPEYMWSYEGGLKADWLDRRLRTNLTGFYYDFTNLQVTTDKPPIGEVTNNAGAAHVKGIEFETQARPIAPLTVYANLAYLDARYTRYPSAYVTEFGEFNAAGKVLNNAPKWSFTVGGAYDFDLQRYGSASLGVDYRWQSREYFSAANNGVEGVTDYAEQQGAYGLLNAHLTWHSADGLYSASLIGRNLTETRYITATATYTAAISGLPGDPRTVLVQVSRRW